MILENYFLVFSVQTSVSLGICYKLALKKIDYTAMLNDPMKDF